MSYTDLVCVGDRLVAQYKDTYSGFGTTISSFVVIDRDYAVCNKTGKKYKLNRRGNDARLFVGNAKVVGRV